MPTIDDIVVTPPEWQETVREAHALRWEDELGDAFSLDFFDVPPDIGASLSDGNGIRSYYREVMIANGLGLIESDVIELDGLTGIATCREGPDPTNGLCISWLHHFAISELQLRVETPSARGVANWHEGGCGIGDSPP